MSYLRHFLLLFLFGPMWAGAGWAAGGMTEVTYMDQEATGGGYVTRYLVTERYLRLDYGRDREDFVLFDRKERRAYNISHERQEVLVFEPGILQIKPPKKWEIKEDFFENRGGRKRLDLIVNGTVCTRLAATEQFLPEVAQALQEFHTLMAATHAGTYLTTPEEQRDDCDLARLILDPQRWFKYGMPYDELRSNGFSRRLLNYQADVPVRLKVLEVPATYRLIRFNQLEGATQ